MKFGENLELIRKRWGMTQDELGGLLGGLSSAQIGRYEKNKNEPGLINLIKLVEITGLSFYSLCMAELDQSMVPEKPLEGIEMDLFSEADTPHQKLKKLEAAYEKMKDRMMEVYEENRQLHIENKGLRAWIEEKIKMDKD